MGELVCDCLEDLMVGILKFWSFEARGVRAQNFDENIQFEPN